MIKQLIAGIVSIFFLTCNCFSQENIKLPEFGKIDISDLQMTDCAFEKGAHAMNLFKYEEAEFVMNLFGEIKIVTQTRCRIKIFDKNGYPNASIVIPYYGKNRDSKITGVQAVTYNLDENGKVIISNLDSKELYQDKAADKKGLNSIRFTFRDIQPGSVIEYRYTRTEKDSYFIAPWFFQTDIPVLLSACKIKFPSISYFDKKIISALAVEEGSRFTKSKDWPQSVEKTFAMRNIPSFKAEPYMSSLRDNIQRVEFALAPQKSMWDDFLSTTGKWREIGSYFLRSPYFGKQFNTALSQTENFIDSAKQIDSLPGRINAVYQYVKRNMSWDRDYSFLAENIDSAWEDKQGSSAEINIILLNLLRKAGVECYPVLVSTRKNGMTDIDFANVSQLNSMDVIVWNQNKYYLLDATEKNTPFNIPPLSVLNRYVYIVDREKNKWLYIADARPLLKDSVSVTATFNEDGLLTGEAVITYYDLAKDENIKDQDSDEPEKKQNDFLTEAPDLKTDTVYRRNGDNDLMPLETVIKFHGSLPSTGQFYFLNPFLFSGFDKNPFTDTVRNTDIDFGANASFILHMEITLPASIKPGDLDKDKIITTPDSILLFSRFNDFRDNKLIINSRFDIQQAYFDKTGYPAIKEFFERMYAILNQQILLKGNE